MPSMMLLANAVRPLGTNPGRERWRLRPCRAAIHSNMLNTSAPGAHEPHPPRCETRRGAYVLTDCEGGSSPTSGPAAKGAFPRSAAVPGGSYLSPAFVGSSVSRPSAGIGTQARAMSSADFYADWQYVQPSDILPFIDSRAKFGDAHAVIEAIDEFGKYYPMYKCGDEKGKILEEIVSQVKPTVVVELGSFLGYSATRMAGKLPSGGHIITVEAKPENAATAKAVIKRAGRGEVVEVLGGRLAADALPDVSARVNGGAVDLIFMDHFKDCYLPDLKQMEALGLLHEGTVVVADNVVYPGAPGFLEYVDTDRKRYDTKLLPAKFEYDQNWKKDWSPKMDALSYSVYRGSN